MFAMSVKCSSMFYARPNEMRLQALTENISVEEVCARFGIPEHGVQECMAIARRGLGMLPKVDGRFIQFRRDFPVSL